MVRLSMAHSRTPAYAIWPTWARQAGRAGTLCGVSSISASTGAPAEVKPVPAGRRSSAFALGYGHFAYGARDVTVDATPTPTGHATPVPPMPQYPLGFLARYCWW